MIPSKYQNTLRVFSRHPSHKVLRDTVEVPYPTVIRLGSITSPKYSNYISINTPEAVSNTANKLTMKKLFRQADVMTPEFYILFKDHAGIYTPEGFRHISFENLSDQLSYPVLFKKTYRSRGAGMLKVNNKERFMEVIKEHVLNNIRHQNNPYYVEKFYTHVKEYRVHVSCLTDDYFYSCRKMLRNDVTSNRWYRNDSNSVWIMESNPLFEKPKTWQTIVEDCQRARKALGLDICALDIKVNKRGEHLILEANSAPSFGEVTADKYLVEIPQIVHQKHTARV